MAKRLFLILLLISILTYTGCGGGGGGKKKQPPLLSTIQGTVTLEASESTSHYRTDSMSAFSKSAFFPKAAIQKTNFSPRAVPNEKIVKFRPETSYSQAEDIVAKMGGKIKKKIYGTDSTYLITINDQTFSKSAANHYPEVEYIEDNLIYQALAAPKDPFYKPPYNWNYKMLNLEKAWDVQGRKNIEPGKEIIVAVLDTGIAPNHEDLKGNLVSGYDCVEDDPDPSDLKNGHGTHVAGIIGAITNNQHGTAGVGWNVVKIMPIRVLDSNGNGTTAELIEGIDYAVNNGAKIINLSLGGSIIDEGVKTKINEAHAANITVIAAAGNEGGAVTSPANYDPVIAVASLDHTCSRPSYSNYGPKIDFCAPGGGEPRTQHLAEWAVKTVFNTYYSGYAYMAGTSQAAPHISGLVALLYAKHANDLEEFTPAKVKTLLKEYCIDLGDPGRDDYYGYGLPDAFALLSETKPVMANVKVFIGTSKGAIISNLQHVGASGDFTLSDLKAGTYYIYAFEDANNNNVVDSGEKINHISIQLPKDTIITGVNIPL